MINVEDRIALLSRHVRSFLDTSFNLSRFCFPEQLEFISSPASFKTAVCSRRSGKTIACAADLTDTALKYDRVVCLYITLSRKNAKRIIWPELLALNREFNLGGVTNDTDLSITYPNGSVIYVSGAKDKSEIENFRGLALKKVYVDECQSFRAYIQELIDDVLAKALFDYNGTLCLIGTPGMVPAGYFYESSHSSHWDNFKWTMFNNPHLERKSGKKVMELVEADCKRMGVDINHPKIQRECFGLWTVDTDSLVFKYDKVKNGYIKRPDLVGKWEYVIGVDLGYDDADAIAVIGWHSKVKEVYLVEEVVKRKQGITELTSRISELIIKYDPLKVVMDTGGLGKKIAEEMRKRYSLPIVAAEKARKFEYIELVNDALRTGKFFAKIDSQFAQDALLVEWDKSLDPTKLKISDNYHSDICDATLYAFREALHWLYVPESVPILTNTPQWYQKQIDEMEQAALRALHKKEDDILNELLSNM